MSGSWAKPSTVRERSLHSTATSSRAKEAGHLPWARSSSHRDKVAWGRRPVKSAPWQRRALAWLAESRGPWWSGWSWPAPWRGNVSAFSPPPWDRMAFKYSTPKMQLGFSSRAAVSSPTRRSAARCRRWAKGRVASTCWSAWGNAGESKASASCHRGWMSPSSLPKSSVSTQPRARARATPPAAKRSAPARAQGRGSSSTRSAPLSKARRVRAHLSSRAGSPRWTKFPESTHTRPPKRAFAWANRAWWPLCRGFSSQMMAEIFIFSRIFL